jgi:hypothetical protein
MFKELMNEDKTTTSTMRFLVILVVIAFLFNWTYVTIKTNSWVPLDFGSSTALIGVLIAKAYQKKHENGGSSV